MKKRILDTLPDSKLTYSTQIKAGLADGSIDKNKISEALDRLLNGDFGSAPAIYKNVFTEHLEDGTRDIYGIYDDIVIYYDANVDDLTVTTADEFRRFYKKGWTAENQTAFNTRYAGGGESRRNAKIEGQYLKEGQRRAIVEQLREDYGTEKAGFEKSARLEYKVYPYLQYKGIIKALTEDQLQYLKKLSSEYNVPMHKILNEVGFQHFVQHKNMQTSVDLVERMIQKGVASIMSKDAAHSPHKYYVVLYKDDYGWSPAEGGTVYFAGERVSKKEGPFTYEEAQEKLKEKADIFGDVGTIRSGKDYLVIDHPEEEGTLYYRIERDDRWGSKQTGGGGWDWSAEKDPAKHPFRGKYVVIDKTTGEVVAESRNRKDLRKPVEDYDVKIFLSEKRFPDLELHMYGDQGSHKVVGKYHPDEVFASDSVDEGRNCYIVKYKNMSGRKVVTGNFAEVSDLMATSKKGPFTREEAQKLLDNQEAEAKERGKYYKSNSKDGYLFIDFGDYSVTYRIECKEPDADPWPNASKKDPVPQPYRDLKKFTIHGYPIVAVYKDAEDRKFVIIKMGAQYAYGAGYNPKTGKCDFVNLGFTDPSDAIVDMQEHYGRMKKTTL